MAETGQAGVAAASAPAAGVSPGALRKRAPWSVEAAVEGRASPLAHLSRAQRVARLLGLLEAAACAGDVSAARELLAWERWRREMKEGRPAARVEVEARGTIRVVDSLGVPVGRGSTGGSVSGTVGRSVAGRLAAAAVEGAAGQAVGVELEAGDGPDGGEGDGDGDGEPGTGRAWRVREADGGAAVGGEAAAERDRQRKRAGGDPAGGRASSQGLPVRGPLHSKRGTR